MRFGHCMCNLADEALYFFSFYHCAYDVDDKSCDRTHPSFDLG